MRIALTLFSVLFQYSCAQKKIEEVVEKFSTLIVNIPFSCVNDILLDFKRKQIETGKRKILPSLFFLFRVDGPK